MSEQQGDSSLLPRRYLRIMIMFRLKPANKLRLIYYVFTFLSALLLFLQIFVLDSLVSRSTALLAFYLLYVLSLLYSLWTIYTYPNIPSVYKYKDFINFRKSSYNTASLGVLILAISSLAVKILFEPVYLGEIALIILCWNSAYIVSIDSFFYLNHKFSKSNDGV